MFQPFKFLRNFIAQRGIFLQHGEEFSEIVDTGKRFLQRLHDASKRLESRYGFLSFLLAVPKTRLGHSTFEPFNFFRFVVVVKDRP